MEFSTIGKEKQVQKKFEILVTFSQLLKWEIPKSVHLVHEAWTMENDGLTPTHKIRRHFLAKKYAKEIEAMYAKMKSEDFVFQQALEEALEKDGDVCLKKQEKCRRNFELFFFAGNGGSKFREHGRRFPGSCATRKYHPKQILCGNSS